jgi:lipoprotein signal peptidase
MPCQRSTASYRGWVEAAALNSPGTRRAVFGIAALVLAADQVSKSLVVAAAPGGAEGGPVSVRLVRNTGASFGIGAGHPVVITLVAAAVLAIAAVLLARARLYHARHYSGSLSARGPS